MKKGKLIILLCTILLIGSTSYVLAIRDPLAGQGIGGWITNAVATVLKPIAMAAAILCATIGAGYIVISQGSPQKLQKGTKYIAYAVLGAAIISSAVVIAGSFQPAS